MGPLCNTADTVIRENGAATGTDLRGWGVCLGWEIVGSILVKWSAKDISAELSWPSGPKEKMGIMK